MIVKYVDLQILTDFDVLNPPQYKKEYVMVCRLHVGMFVSICATIAPERVYGFSSYSGFVSLWTIGLCTKNLNRVASNGGPSDAPQNRQRSLNIIHGGHVSKLNSARGPRGQNANHGYSRNRLFRLLLLSSQK